MPRLKVLSGKDIIKIFESLGFLIDGQKGSHVKLARRLSDGVKQTLTVPNHVELDKGTLKAIYNQALKYVSEEKLKEYFYNID